MALEGRHAGGRSMNQQIKHFVEIIALTDVVPRIEDETPASVGQTHSTPEPLAQLKTRPLAVSACVKKK